MIVRPGQSRQEIGTVQEPQLSQQILEKLEKLADGQDYLKVWLIGGEYKEIVHPGRLPMLEKEIELVREQNKLIKVRVESLEEDRRQLRTIIRTASRIAGMQGAVIGAVLTLVIEFLRHR